MKLTLSIVYIILIGFCSSHLSAQALIEQFSGEACSCLEANREIELNDRFATCFENILEPYLDSFIVEYEIDTSSDHEVLAFLESLMVNLNKYCPEATMELLFEAGSQDVYEIQGHVTKVITDEYKWILFRDVDDAEHKLLMSTYFEGAEEFLQFLSTADFHSVELIVSIEATDIFDVSLNAFVKRPMIIGIRDVD